MTTAEIFGPVFAVYVYEDKDYGDGLFELIDQTTEFALSGAVFDSDREAISQATEQLRCSAGNFYIK